MAKNGSPRRQSARDRRALAWVQSERVYFHDRGFNSKPGDEDRQPIPKVKLRQVPAIMRTALDWTVARQINGNEGGKDYAVFRKPKIKIVAENVGEILVAKFGIEQATDKMEAFRWELRPKLEFHASEVRTFLVGRKHHVALMPNEDTARFIREERRLVEYHLGADLPVSPDGVIVGTFLDSGFAEGLEKRIRDGLENQPADQTVLHFGGAQLFVGDTLVGA